MGWFFTGLLGRRLSADSFLVLPFWCAVEEALETRAYGSPDEHTQAG